MPHPPIPAWAAYRIAERIFSLELDIEEARSESEYNIFRTAQNAVWMLASDLGIKTQVEDAVEDYAQANDEGDPQ